MFLVLKVIISYGFLVICVLLSVAIVTLMEQKIIGASQVRIGPNVVGYWGLLQPFADAVKLFFKEGLIPLMSFNLMIYFISPAVMLLLALLFWVLYPYITGGMDYKLGVLWFLCISGLGVYPILSGGWVSNCKYSLLGSLRSVAQMISYEVSLLLILLSMIWCFNTYDLLLIMKSQMYIWAGIMFMPLMMVWLVSSLAETNRSPYDFSEGESELVSGFNTEYSAGGFTLIFMSEYSNILFMSLLFVMLFFSSEFNWFSVMKGMLVMYLFVWVRTSYPRYRYDKLMYLAWKKFLPFILMSFIFFFLLS
uniref:NADH-ubiquinone oxidoreductase chain 1 n=1 Tax=Halice sp. JL-2018 TaxID=2528348 RepID=A0A3S8IFB0_9CRUS|nr:NADH dehydrogenase subunit 1 [Halice sp. JL-2018]